MTDERAGADISAPFDATMEERLARLRRTIDEWDWRAGDQAASGIGDRRRGGPAHARAPGSTRRRRRRLLVGGLVACAVLIGAIVVLARGTPGPGPGANPSAADVSRVEAATNDASAATATVRAGFASLAGLPTPATVAALVGPYLSALNLYGTFLGGAPVPVAAAPAVRGLQGEVRQDVSFLRQISSISGADLGAYLQSVLARTSRLQADLHRLEHALRPGTGG